MKRSVRKEITDFVFVMCFGIVVLVSIAYVSLDHDKPAKKKDPCDKVIILEEVVDRNEYGPCDLPGNDPNCN